jgi:hypothetical protein
MRGTVNGHVVFGGVVLALLSCGGNGDGTGPDSPGGTLRVIQAAESTATAGERTVAVRPSGGAASPSLLRLAVAADAEYTAVVIDSSTVLNPIALTDSGGVPAAGKSKLQVANFVSLAGPIDVYRRQPDFDGLVDLMFPFAYRAVSGYVQSDPGDWQVLVASEARVGGVPPDVPQDTLLIVEPVSLAAGQAATVVLVDKAGGGIDAVVVRDR